MDDGTRRPREIHYTITAVPRDTKITIEIHPGLGASYPFFKITLFSIAPDNVIH